MTSSPLLNKTFPALPEFSDDYPERETKPNAVGILQVFNEMSVDPTHLPRVLASLADICHSIIVYDDGSTDTDTREYLSEWKHDHARLLLILGSVNDWESEIAHKAQMLSICHDMHRRGDCDWVVWLDADEQLSRDAVKVIHDHARDNAITGIFFHEVNLWRDRGHYRTDSRFADGDFLRVWRMHPRLEYGAPKTGLHQQQFPRGALDFAIRTDPEKEVVLHYSWDSPKKIAAKNERYACHGDLASVRRMQDGPHVQRLIADPAWFPRLPVLNWRVISNERSGIMMGDDELCARSFLEPGNPIKYWWHLGPGGGEVHETEVQLLCARHEP